ncbi:MAG: hypothetical protein PHP23_01340 [Desulfobacterales bacterium]|nr:hypothetical protein [Desulfobacterales bacterium]MDD4071153.1 hypothetical protein [Desulfobacterales bacterium]MDD4392589.1 hypothetical protein [Desulfobacterales bacterium]
MMGFIRRQEERLAISLLMRQYGKRDIPAPELAELKRQSGKIIDEAHRIARERGKNVMSIMKELVVDFKKKNDKSDTV